MINCITNANALDKNRIFIFLFFFILKIKNKYQKQICKSRQFLCSVSSVERKKLKSKKKKQGKSFLKELTIFFFLIRRTHNFLSPLVFKFVSIYVNKIKSAKARLIAKQKIHHKAPRDCDSCCLVLFALCHVELRASAQT